MDEKTKAYEAVLWNTIIKEIENAFDIKVTSFEIESKDRFNIETKYWNFGLWEDYMDVLKKQIPHIKEHTDNMEKTMQSTIQEAVKNIKAREPIRPKKQYCADGITAGKRFDVHNRDNFKCQYCWRRAPYVILEIDHMIPRSKWWTDHESNLITSCFQCNRGKSAKKLNSKFRPLAK
jgi:uncharacterized repeat protein (TIGR04076 family)